MELFWYFFHHLKYSKSCDQGYSYWEVTLVPSLPLGDSGGLSKVNDDWFCWHMISQIKLNKINTRIYTHTKINVTWGWHKNKQNVWSINEHTEMSEPKMGCLATSSCVLQRALESSLAERLHALAKNSIDSVGVSGFWQETGAGSQLSTLMLSSSMFSSFFPVHFRDMTARNEKINILLASSWYVCWLVMKQACTIVGIYEWLKIPSSTYKL